MDFNDNVISQGIVLASILAGFGLATAAQIALSSGQSEKRKSIAHLFIASSLFSVTAAILGMIAMGLETDTNQFHVSVLAYVVCLVFALVGFVFGIDGLIDRTTVANQIDFPFLLSWFSRILLAIVMIVFLLLIITSRDFVLLAIGS
jgi:hypothetical protein